MTRTVKHHIVIALSGGVDSAVGAWLLLRRGHRVTGVFMKNWEEDDHPGYCAAAEDHAVARAVCERLQIPLRAVNFSPEYWQEVFVRFLAENAVGRTPNPDVLCNREIKFKAFLDYALSLGADRIATGHYARVVRDGERYQLLKGCDPDKDQSYFLYMLDQRALSKACFPVGELSKREVRALAHCAGLPNHARKGSTGLCFIGERPFKPFLQRYLPPQRGEIRTIEGEPKGEHDGLMYYTIGQRHGLGIGGPGGPWYVVDKDTAHNVLYVAAGDGHPAMHSAGLQAHELHWVGGSPPMLPLDCRAKIRYRSADAACRVEADSTGGVHVTFAHAQRAVTPGQAVVFYHGDACLGGGTIMRTDAGAVRLSDARAARVLEPLSA